MTSCIDALRAELCAIEYWESLYEQDASGSESDELSHLLRQARRAEIMSELESLKLGGIRQLSAKPASNLVCS